MATLLKYYFRPTDGHDALAVSLGKNSVETKIMLFEWADRILVADEVFVADIPLSYRWKTTVVPIGRDMWGHSMHPELIPVVVPLLEAAGFEPKANAVVKAITKQGKFDRRRRGEE